MPVGQIDVFPLPRGAASGVGTIGGWYISSYFGGRIDPLTGRPGNHGGMDLPAPRLTPMYAVKPGRIYQSWDPSGGGNWTRLVADDGDVFGYGHADHFAPGPSGRHVEAGEIIAYVGTTGGSTGNHLHFAYQPAGRSSYADPYNLLVGVSGTFMGSPAPVPTPIPTAPKPSVTIREEPPMPNVIYKVHGSDALYVLDVINRICRLLAPDEAETLRLGPNPWPVVEVPAGGATHRLIEPDSSDPNDLTYRRAA